MRNLVNFHVATQISENITLMGSFSPKHIMFELENYRRVMCHDTEERCNIGLKKS